MNSFFLKHISKSLFLLLSLSITAQPQLNKDYEVIPEGLVKTIEVFSDFPDRYPFLRFVSLYVALY